MTRSFSIGASVGIATAAAVGLAAANAFPSVTAIAPLRRRVTPGLSGLSRRPGIALTFDDGPDPASTPAVLESLAAAGVHATFFLLATMVQRSPGLAAEIVAAGHEVGVHGWDHRCVLLQHPRQTVRDISRARELIGEVTATEPVHYRPPYGILSVPALAVTRRLGLKPVLWTASGQEWKPDSTGASVWHTLSQDLEPGATILLHDSDCTSPPGSARAALDSLPQLYDECQRLDLPLQSLAERVSEFR